MINEWLETISPLIRDGMWLAPLLTLVSGVLTAFTPCALSSVPLVIGYVSASSNNDTKKAFRLSLVFAIGMAVTFTTLGVIASLAGRLIGRAASWWYIILGILMVLMALQTWEIYNFIPSTFLINKSTKKGYMGSLIAGILGGVFSSPCSTPVLIVLLAVVAGQGRLLWGVLLLLLYSVGHSVLVLIAGTSMGFIKKLTVSEKYGKVRKIIKIVLGSLILLIAFYMFYLAF
ncbi:MAG: sulfite exporter TauE/SafE family protein [Actinobacteria bacterium]|nr:sulfite exporter TauE/SafE family protein [Actinomycetota bacterium]MCL6086951.1 sulfite exporter TauE/SafE family protein [Actinomycetota bacterium]